MNSGTRGIRWRSHFVWLPLSMITVIAPPMIAMTERVKVGQKAIAGWVGTVVERIKARSVSAGRSDDERSPMSIVTKSQEQT
jgi:hypothetical protein